MELLFYVHLDTKDYTGGEQTLTFKIGALSASISIPIEDDKINELTERFTAQLFNPQGMTIGPSNTATVDITDNDGKAIESLRKTVKILLHYIFHLFLITSYSSFQSKFTYLPHRLQHETIQLTIFTFFFFVFPPSYCFYIGCCGCSCHGDV